jgi:hypothetical protein
MTYYPDETEPLLRAKLEVGWDWLKEAPDGEEKNAFFDRFLVTLGEYTDRYGSIDLGGATQHAPVVHSGVSEEGDL